MVQKNFDVSFQSDIYNVNNVVNNSLNFLKNNFPKINQDDLMEFKLIYCELLFNAIIHGNKEDKTKNVFLTITIENNYVQSIVSDEGIGFDYKKTLEKGCSEESLFFETGRGIRLVKSLVENLSFEKNGSTIKFCKKVEFDG